jgi:hypothetical protein
MSECIFEIFIVRRYVFESLYASCRKAQGKMIIYGFEQLGRSVNQLQLSGHLV